MTDYYVQTIETSFPHEWGKNSGTGEKPVDSTNNILTSFLRDEGDDNGPTPHIRTKSGYTLSYPNQRIFSLGAGGYYPRQLPIGSTSDNFLSDVIAVDNYEWWDKRLDDYTGFWSQAWYNTYSWTDPDSDYSTWLQEVVDFIDRLKGTADYWGTDRGEINIYVFKYRYADYPTSGWAYYPIFYQGNNVAYDTIMTPST